MNPLQEVWIRPRKVFRELAGTPVGATDYLLAAAQGMASALVLGRMQGWGLTEGIGESLLKAAVQGGGLGIAAIWIYASLYAWLGRHTGGVASKTQLIHVFTYGSVPLAALLGIWCLAALILGNQAFVDHPIGETDLFVSLLMGVQTAAYLLLALWSTVLQIMGLSEMHRIRSGAALGTWLLGQFVVALALAVISLLLLGMGADIPKT
jgi:hypothetical protein